MSSNDIGALVLTLSILLPLVHLLAYIFERLKQPRLVGELVAGVLVGPAVFGVLAPELSAKLFGGNNIRVILDLFYWLGLLLLIAQHHRTVSRQPKLRQGLSVLAILPPSAPGQASCYGRKLRD